jgi:hypothetical protein
MRWLSIVDDRHVSLCGSGAGCGGRLRSGRRPACADSLRSCQWRYRWWRQCVSRRAVCRGAGALNGTPFVFVSVQLPSLTAHTRDPPPARKATTGCDGLHLLRSAISKISRCWPSIVACGGGAWEGGRSHVITRASPPLTTVPRTPLCTLLLLRLVAFGGQHRGYQRLGRSPSMARRLILRVSRDRGSCVRVHACVRESIERFRLDLCKLCLGALCRTPLPTLTLVSVGIAGPQLDIVHWEHLGEEDCLCVRLPLPAVSLV